jgi:hypothetical protein
MTEPDELALQSGESSASNGVITDLSPIGWVIRSISTSGQTEFPNVCILENIGAGAAVWNIENYAVKYESGSIWLNEFPLIFYHFHGFKFFSGGFFTSSLVGYGLQLSLLDSIYRPYVSEITDICSKNRFTGKGLTLREILKFMSARNLHHNQKVIRVALNFMSWLLGLLKR